MTKLKLYIYTLRIIITIIFKFKSIFTLIIIIPHEKKIIS